MSKQKCPPDLTVIQGDAATGRKKPVEIDMADDAPFTFIDTKTRDPLSPEEERALLQAQLTP